MKPYSLNLKVWKEDNFSDRTAKGRIYRPFKKALRSFWKRKLRKSEDN
jgi:hypothetical protein